MNLRDLNRFKAWQILLFLVGIYMFILSLEGFKQSWGILFEVGDEATTAFVLKALENRLIAFFSGLLITTLLQSSSATIALIISTVGSGVMSVETSIPMILGANLGTTVTNTMVALGHAGQKTEFIRVVPAAIVDDLFKIYNVGLFFLLELTTGFLHTISEWVTHSLCDMSSDPESLMPDFLAVITDPVVEPAIHGIVSLIGDNPMSIIGTMALSFVLLLSGLSLMGRAMRKLFEESAKQKIDRVFSSKPLAVLLGFGFCWLLQSSSVTTSLILPFVAHGSVQLYHVYYYAMGAAIGTTIDAGQIVSYVKFGLPGISAGVIHVAINLFGVLLFLFIPGLNQLPVITAQMVAGMMERSKYAIPLFIGLVMSVFYLIPFAVIMLL